MTSEQIHDALNLLPPDLVTEADKLRNPRKTPIRFRTWVATAACAALVLMISSFSLSYLTADTAKSAESIAEAPATAAPMEMQENSAMDTVTDIPSAEPEEEAPDEKAQGENALSMDAGIRLAGIQYLSTPVLPAVNTEGDPRTDLITSREALDQYLESKSDIYHMDAFLDNSDQYNNAWFLSNDLLILRIGASHPEFHYDVTGFARQPDTEPAAWQITLSRNPDEPTDIAFDNNSMWHILIPIPKGMVAEDATILIDFQ